MSALFMAVSDIRTDSRLVRRVVLVAGGTAGHVYPALALANAYRCFRSPVEVLFFGTEDGFAAKLIPRHGYPLQIVPGRPIVGENLPGKMRAIATLGNGVLAARHKLLAAGADLVIGFGGYASVPTILAARSLGLPTAIHESNAVAGLANRMLGRFVDRVYLGFDAAAAQFPAGRALVTGNPVRSDVQALAAQLHHPPSPQRPCHILVTGGSQGSAFLNREMPKFLKRLADANLEIKVFHRVDRQIART
jgi:UDP-N-acetylglucosamine--N-acetylmuramyl-(pentapeptide) pyrophosphoryl-undecaprenol N-acetylglucosamine transferase